MLKPELAALAPELEGKVRVGFVDVDAEPEIAAAFGVRGIPALFVMKDGEVDMITGWNGRFDAVAKDGGRVAYTFNQGSSDMDCYAIPKGAPNKANAMRFLNEIIKAPYQAEFTKYINYGPTNKKAFEGNAIPAAAARRNPSHPENLAKQLQIDQSWYVKNRARANALFQDMMTE